MMLPLLLLCFLLTFCSARSQVAAVGHPLPAWKQGYLDLHHINTGVGDAALYVFPDGTSLVFDAGEIPPTDPRAFTPRNAFPKPDSTRRAYEWIDHYIRKVLPRHKRQMIDYAVISHFHDDHFGCWWPGAAKASSGPFVRTGITGLGDLLPIGRLLDRGYPSYDYPYDQLKHGAMLSGELDYDKTFANYLAFQRAMVAKGMKVERLRAGSETQVRSLYSTTKLDSFSVRAVKVNDLVWSGVDSSTKSVFPQYQKNDKSTWPDENSLSIVLLINYGKFRYYTGGDCAGNVFYGSPTWKDVETPVAKVVGKVDVATMDHHGNRDAINETHVRTLQPRVWIGQSWSADHPGHEVLVRMTSKYLYDGPRDLFSTNMLEANRHVIGPLIDRSYKSTQGHIVVRVLPGGSEYYVIVLDDSTPDMLVKSLHGPYQASGNAQRN